ncbi:MAG: alpha/beta hydrolase family protein, partial [Sciscionella sp.]
VDAVASVSGPARWFERGTAAMRRVNWLIEQPPGRLVSRALGTRLGEPWGDPPPISPLELAHRIAPTPLLVVHGDADHYFPVAHAQLLHAAAGANSELWLLPGIRHGETAMQPELVDRVVSWLRAQSLTATTAPGTA